MAKPLHLCPQHRPSPVYPEARSQDSWNQGRKAWEILLKAWDLLENKVQIECRCLRSQSNRALLLPGGFLGEESGVGRCHSMRLQSAVCPHPHPQP